MKYLAGLLSHLLENPNIMQKIHRHLPRQNNQITIQNMGILASFGMVPLLTRVPLKDIQQILLRIFTSRLLSS